MEHKTTVIFASLQILSVVLYAFFADYGDAAKADLEGDFGNSVYEMYGMFQDVQVMIFVGFGFLMTFLHKYAHNSLGYTFFVAALCIQYSILISGFFHRLFVNDWTSITIELPQLITGNFAAAVVLISLGAVLGKVSPAQMVLIAISELVFFALNENIGVEVYEASDMGGSMYVHAFGAYFGLGLSLALRNENKEKEGEKRNTSTYASDIFAMIGTLFLWMYWPSFNGALASGNARHRVVINTVLSLCGSCVASFFTSSLFRKGFNMVDIQNASLAGGVAVGAVSNLNIGPAAALILGTVSGFVSVLGYVCLTPYLERFGVRDTCGVHNLHGIPGVLSGLASFLVTTFTRDSDYGSNLVNTFPGRQGGRSAEIQGLLQLAALFTTLVLSIASGFGTGYFVKQVDSPEFYFDDSKTWSEQEETKETEEDNL